MLLGRNEDLETEAGKTEEAGGYESIWKPRLPVLTFSFPSSFILKELMESADSPVSLPLKWDRAK